jgi:serine/threonine protein kinase
VAGRYRLVSVIATGGMGVVWEAYDERLERSVALKQLRPLPGVSDEEAQLAKDRAMREARITARLHHPHAVPVFDAVEHEGQPCLVMQLLPSTPLSTVLREGGPLSVSRVARIGHEIASALAAAHVLGIVHRDVKPGNVLITADGSSHISDFGISHALGDATLTHTGMLHGTPAYLAPEAARGEEASFPADVFSLGSTLYAALEGAPPFGSDGNSIALLHKVAAAEVPVPTRAGELTAFLLDMLSSEPDARPSMAQVADRLAQLSPDVEHATEPGAPRRAEPATAVLAPGVPAPSQDDDLLPWFSPDEADEGRPGPTRPSGASQERRRPSRALILAGAAVAAALVLLAAALTDNLPGGSDQSGGASSPTASATQPPPSATPEPSPTQPSPTQPEATQPTSRQPTPSTSAPSSPTPDRASRLSSAITGYYALLPGDPARAWPRLTAGYQVSPSGGRSSFERFWGGVDEVTVSDVRAEPPDRVVATLRYEYANGRVNVERTSYRLVEEDGILKIAASEVLSSRRG